MALLMHQWSSKVEEELNLRMERNPEEFLRNSAMNAYSQKMSLQESFIFEEDDEVYESDSDDSVYGSKTNGVVVQRDVTAVPQDNSDDDTHHVFAFTIDCPNHTAKLMRKTDETMVEKHEATLWCECRSATAQTKLGTKHCKRTDVVCRMQHLSTEELAAKTTSQKSVHDVVQAAYARLNSPDAIRFGEHVNEANFCQYAMLQLHSNPEVRRAYELITRYTKKDVSALTACLLSDVPDMDTKTEIQKSLRTEEESAQEVQTKRQSVNDRQKIDNHLNAFVVECRRTNEPVEFSELLDNIASLSLDSVGVFFARAIVHVATDEELEYIVKEVCKQWELCFASINAVRFLDALYETAAKRPRKIYKPLISELASWVTSAGSDWRKCLPVPYLSQGMKWLPVLFLMYGFNDAFAEVVSLRDEDVRRCIKNKHSLLIMQELCKLDAASMEAKRVHEYANKMYEVMGNVLRSDWADTQRLAALRQNARWFLFYLAQKNAGIYEWSQIKSTFEPYANKTELTSPLFDTHSDADTNPAAAAGKTSPSNAAKAPKRPHSA